jgi:hypothetical protein
MMVQVQSCSGSVLIGDRWAVAVYFPRDLPNPAHEWLNLLRTVTYNMNYFSVGCTL